MLRSPGLRTFGLAAALSLSLAIPAQQAKAQDPLIGGLLGGAAGAIIGGAAGGGRGAALGAIIGGATGAIIASEGQRRRGGYYYWRNGCYMERGDGAYVRVSPNYCGGPVAYGPGPGYAPPPPAYGGGYGPPPPRYGYGPPPPPRYSEAAAYCAQRYRSYDPVSQTFMGYDGIRRPCP
jgi:hypothetical protein